MQQRAFLVPFLLTATLAGSAGCAAAGPAAETAVSRPPGSTPWLVSGAPSPDRPSSAAAGSGAPLTEGIVSGTFLPFPQSARAVTYDPKVVPPGATVQLTMSRTATGTTVRLTAGGLVPRRAYGAHLHTRPCTATPDDAGPHYQHSADPKTPSVDPAYANPRNEVWLDLTADTAGAATVTARQDWTFDEVEPPRSLILHAEHTRTAAGKAGTAGPRVACLTLATR